MTIPKPKHLGPEYADQFRDRSVAEAYVNYPPYADEVFQVLDGLERRQLFAVDGRKRTAPQEYSMNVDQYVELFHARNGFSRQRMDAHSANAFDAAVRNLVSPFADEHVLTFNVTTDITWGHPLAGTRIDRH